MSKVVRKKKMMILWIIIAVILLVTLWFNIPYSPFKNQFRKDVAKRCLLSEQSEGVGAQIRRLRLIIASLILRMLRRGLLLLTVKCLAFLFKVMTIT